MKSFDEVLNETEYGDRHLLLGNGFSQSWNRHIFSYQNLLDKADFGHRSRAIKGIFEKLDTYDFETVMQTMLSSVYVAQSFNEYPVFVKGIQRDAECLKNTLITTITKNHPQLPSEIDENQYIAARMFLSKFSNIFTVNYDLLLYWVRNKPHLAPEYFQTDDGFRHQMWCGRETEQNVFFMHGGLHLYDESGVIKKHVYNHIGESIIDQVRRNLESDKFPVFVAEPNYDRKLDRILHNPYLNHCFESLGNIHDSLVIFGHSMDETDTHIFEKANESGISNVYVSIFGNPNSQSNRRTKANSESYFHHCTVHFYQAESAPVWGRRL